jgi:hypothetical protein
MHKQKGTLPVPTDRTAKGKKEGSLLTRMSKLMKENPHVMYCRRGMLEIFFPSLNEERDSADWNRAYWDVASMFEVMVDDNQVAVKKVGVTHYYHWVG